MPKYYTFICSECEDESIRYRNCRHCRLCGGLLIRIEPSTADDRIKQTLFALQDADYAMVSGNSACEPVPVDVVKSWLRLLHAKLTGKETPNEENGMRNSEVVEISGLECG